VIRALEELSMNAWPALRVMCYDGWILRFANGYTRRANSVIPLYPSEREIAEKIKTCERVYKDQGLAVTFKMTAESQPQALDELLAAQGYQRDAQTSVQLLNLSRLDGAPTPDVSAAPSVTDGWLAAFCQMSKMTATHQATHRQLLEVIMPAKCFAAIGVDGQAVGCGLGVMQNGYVGLFDIVIDTGFRRQGYGEQLVQGLLSWGKREGAHTAYLQVMLNNGPALRLYAKLGFQEIYQYWYRLKR
jgi:ribosomal protein S18 acetylase RimI-like enzyme